jgi:hypothetical protein
MNNPQPSTLAMQVFLPMNVIDDIAAHVWASDGGVFI